MRDLWDLVANPWWWAVFVTILLSGVGGGLARFVQMRVVAPRDTNWLACAVMGVAAAFLVPLFLNTISSSLITDTRDQPEKFFVLIGFCIAAAFFAQQFMDSVGRKALQMSQEAKALAKAAESTAQSANDHARSADNRAIAMWKVIQLVDNEAYEEALAEAELVIATDPGNAECWAWKAFCHKRLREPKAAVTAIDEALRIENRDVCNWLFNAACYRALNGESFTEIKPFLLRAWHACLPTQRASLLAAIQSEADLACVSSREEFHRFMTTLERSR